MFRTTNPLAPRIGCHLALLPLPESPEPSALAPAAQALGPSCTGSAPPRRGPERVLPPCPGSPPPVCPAAPGRRPHGHARSRGRERRRKRGTKTQTQWSAILRKRLAIAIAHGLIRETDLRYFSSYCSLTVCKC